MLTMKKIVSGLHKKKKKCVCIEKIVHDSQQLEKNAHKGVLGQGVDKPELVLVSSLNSHHLRRT
jgi:hypothetical protein